jgi:prepilin-type N-terminal cleavage/methylation domain-containing protein
MGVPDRQAVQGIAGFQRGFSLLELIVVMLILSVMATYVAVQWRSDATFTIHNQADLLARNIRHAQSLAMAWEQNLRLTASGASYSVTCVAGTGSAPCVSAGDVVTDPANGQAFTVTLDDGVTVSGTATDFDELGRPNSSGTLLTGTRNFTLSGGGKSLTIAVSPLTGFVQVN